MIFRKLFRRLLDGATSGEEASKPEPNKAPSPTPKLQDFRLKDYCTACTPVGIYAVDLSMRHRPAVQLVLSGREHEPQVVAFIKSRCGEGDVIQAGAFFGDMLPGISSGLANGAYVWSFEPNPRSHYLASQTISLNKLENVKLAKAGLGAESGSSRLVIRRKDGVELGGMSYISGSGNTDSGDAGSAIEVKIIRIDDAVPHDRLVSILQLDVEGFEIQTLHGARETLLRCEPILILEFVEDEKDINNVVPELRYKPVGRLDSRNTVFIPTNNLG